MEHTNILFAVSNIAAGVLFILLSLPLVKKKVPMNKLYGFRLSKSYASDENWFTINSYGGKQLILWSLVLIGIGLWFLFFPLSATGHELVNGLIMVGPMVLCIAIVTLKTILFAGTL